jgi:hypothetical protein
MEHPDAAAYLFRHMMLSRPEKVTDVAKNLTLPFEIFGATGMQVPGQKQYVDPIG